MRTGSWLLKLAALAAVLLCVACGGDDSDGSEGAAASRASDSSTTESTASSTTGAASSESENAPEDEVPGDGASDGGSPGETSTSENAGTAQGSGVHGTVRSVSDVSGEPDRPVTTGFVVLVPSSSTPGFWEALGFDPGGPPEPAAFGVTVDPAALPAGVVITPIDDGTFTSELPAGEMLACLADVSPANAPGPPHHLVGCAAASAEDTAAALTVTLGRGVSIER